MIGEVGGARGGISFSCGWPFLHSTTAVGSCRWLGASPPHHVVHTPPVPPFLPPTPSEDFCYTVPLWKASGELGRGWLVVVVVVVVGGGGGGGGGLVVVVVVGGGSGWWWWWWVIGGGGGLE